jgi:hypothetical protein
MNSEPEVRYERRLVGFSDVLGWRSHIADTVTDPARVKWLRVLAQGWSDLSKPDYAIGFGGLRITSFSDNVVLSQEPKEPRFIIARMGIMQVNAAAGGFLVRGGVTVGDIIHTSDFVFGPALNRAYEIENTLAIYPRVLVDPLIIQEFGPIREPVVNEGDEYFVDAFTPRFLDVLSRETSSVVAVGGVKKYLTTLSYQPPGSDKERLAGKRIEKDFVVLFSLGDKFSRN